MDYWRVSRRMKITTITRKNKCPYCSHHIDAATHASDEAAKPKKGDFSVCIYCAGFLVYGKGMKLKRMPSKAWDELPQDLFDALLNTRKAIKNMIAERLLNPDN